MYFGNCFWNLKVKVSDVGHWNPMHDQDEKKVTTREVQIKTDIV